MAVGQEDRVVAEAGRPARREDQLAVDPALERLDPPVRPGERQRADEMRPPWPRRARRLALPLDAGHRAGEIVGSPPAQRAE